MDAIRDHLQRLQKRILVARTGTDTNYTNRPLKEFLLVQKQKFTHQLTETERSIQRMEEAAPNENRRPEEAAMIQKHRHQRMGELKLLAKEARKILDELEVQLQMPEDPYEQAESRRRDLITGNCLSAFVADQLNNKALPRKQRDMIPNSVVALLTRAEEGCVRRDMEHMARFGTLTPMTPAQIKDASRRRVRARIFRWVQRQAERVRLSTEELAQRQIETANRWNDMTEQERDDYLSKELEEDQKDREVSFE